jgi:hypothetical protein
VHRDRLSDDKAIFCELANGLAGVCLGDFGRFVGIEPDFALAAVKDGCRKAFLGAEIGPVVRISVSWTVQKAECRLTFSQHNGLAMTVGLNDTVNSITVE